MRLTRDQLIRQVIQGGGNMPAYGKNLKPAETTALVAFLETLHPPNMAPARDASRHRLCQGPHRAPERRRHRVRSVDPPAFALAVLASWRIDVLPTAILLLTGIIYFRGWRRLVAPA